MTFTKILVPVDFSPHSKEALRIAADMSRCYAAPLMIAHVFEPFAFALPEGYVLYTASQLGEMLAHFGEQLTSSKTDAESFGASSVQTKQLQGPAASAIVDLAQAGKFDLIVMGTHGRTGLQHALMGSVAERVLRRAPCPVLTVRTQ